MKTSQRNKRILQPASYRLPPVHSYGIFFEYAPDYCYMISPEGTILDVNKSALKALKYKKNELVGKPLKLIYAPQSLSKVKKLFAQWKKTGRLKDEELIILTKKGEKRTVLLSSAAMRGEDGEIHHSISIQKDITASKRTSLELKRSRKRLRDLCSYLQQVRERERKRIAHAIHDDLGQLLVILTMELKSMSEKLLPDQKPLQESTQSLIEKVEKTAEAVRRISTELRPRLLDDVGLIPAIKWQVHEFQNHTGIKCDINIENGHINPNIKQATVIFRILQEALTNVARHAHATRVKVDLKEKPDKLILKIRDNGNGITQRQISRPNSFGILGMQESVLPWNGNFDIKGIKDKGTLLKVNLPIMKGKRTISHEL